MLKKDEVPPISRMLPNRILFSFRLYILMDPVTDPAVVNTVSKWIVSAEMYMTASSSVMIDSLRQAFNQINRIVQAARIVSPFLISR
jgi:hypothetical protein